MIEDVDRYVDFLCEHTMTPEQFLLCYLLYTDAVQPTANSKKSYKPTANIFKYAVKVKPFNVNAIKDLIERGYLVDKSRKGEYSPDLLDVTDKFVKAIFVAPDNFDAFWDMYPTYIHNFSNLKGPKILTKYVDKDVARRLYMKAVTTKKLHEEVMDLLHWALHHKLINCGIQKFIESRLWESLREMKRENAGSSDNIVSL